MLFKAAFLASALAAFATAQNATSTLSLSTQSQSMPAVATAGFNIGNTTTAVRSQWCLAQINNCRFICGGTTNTDTCDTPTLTYSCICSNGTVPDVTAFIDTVPFFICQATYGQCIANHPMDQVGQSVCTANEKCGTRNATAEYSRSANAALGSSTSSAASRTSAAASSGTAAASSASSSAASSSDATMTTYTSGAFAMVLMAAFKLFL